MKRNTPFLLVLLSLFALLAAVSPRPGRAAAAERPFQLSGAVQVRGNPFEGAPFTASGKATHLGRWSGEGFVIFAYDADGSLTSTGTLSTKAANGDLLYTSFFATQDPRTGVFTGSYFFDGGIGRFARACGSAVVTATPIGASTFAITVNGTIDY